MWRDCVGMWSTTMTGLRVLIPAYSPHISCSRADDAISPGTRRALDDLIALGAIEPSEILIRPNCGLLVQSRAELLATAYADPTATEFLFLDADISVGAGTIQAMRTLGLDAVGCAYCGRDPTIRDQIMGLPRKPLEIHTLCDHRLLRMRWLAFGCMLLRRTAIDAMYAGLEHFESESGHDAISPWTPIMREHDGKRRLLDDSYACCEVLSDLGIDVWCFLDAVVSHAGYRCFAGALFTS
jgi:hypothetical protein